jgi:DNA-directed RNA polymerase specialized sigma24 family protein
MYETAVFNYVLRMVSDRSLAEDLTQEIFLRVYQGLAGFSLRPSAARRSTRSGARSRP